MSAGFEFHGMIWSWKSWARSLGVCLEVSIRSCKREQYANKHEGGHSSLGVSKQKSSLVPELYSDQDVPFTSNLQSLSSRRGLNSVWLELVAVGNYWTGWKLLDLWVFLVPSEREYYWFLLGHGQFQVYLLFLAIPLEVLVRRWPHLTSLKRT